MKFTLTPLLLPLALVLMLSWGVYHLTRWNFDRWFAWTAVFVAIGGGILAIALHVWDINTRFRDLEKKIDGLHGRIDGESTKNKNG